VDPRGGEHDAELYHHKGPGRGGDTPGGLGEVMTVTRDAEKAGSLFERVAEVLGRIRPAIQADGGDLELIEVTDGGVVRVRFHGACVGCPSSSITLKAGIEQNLRERVPGVTAVEPVD